MRRGGGKGGRKGENLNKGIGVDPNTEIQNDGAEEFYFKKNKK